MAKIRVRFLETRKGSPFPRYFWVPSKELRRDSWTVQRIPDNWESYGDGAALETAAIAKAQELNRLLDEARKAAGQTDIAAPPPMALPRTVENLVKEYRLSDWYLPLGPKTKRDYEQCLVRIIDWAGDCPVRAIDDDRIAALRKGMARTPTFANAVVRVLRRLLSYGVKKRWIMVNPASRPGLSSTPPSGKIWPRAAIAEFIAAADDLGCHAIGTAVLLDEWLGQREGDVIRLPRTVYRNGELVFRQAKGQSLAKGTQGAGMVLPIDLVPELKARLAEQLQRNDDRKVTSAVIIQSEITGQPYKEDFFRHEFARVRAHAAARMRQAKGWYRGKDGLWRHDQVAQRLADLPAKIRAEAMAAAAAEAAMFDLDYLLPGRDIADPDCFKIGMEELQFMHLRHTAITRLGEFQVSPQDIAAISGHSYKTVLQILERYMIRTRTMAVSAFEKRLEGERRSPAAEKEEADG